MIGEDQAKGYREEFEEKQPDSIEVNKDEFEERKKKALKSIGIDSDKEEEEFDSEAIAMMALENMEDHKKKVLDNDIIILRQQNQMIMNKLNNQTKAINELTKIIKQMEGKLKSQTQRSGQ